MASQSNGGINVPGNIRCFGDVTVSGSVSAAEFLKLTPMANPPSPAVEGMIYADTDHTLLYFNGTDWKVIAFV